MLTNAADTQFVMEQIEGVHEGVRLKRVYQMTVDGTSHVDFHQKVDGKGPVVVLIKTSKGVVTGAYTRVGFSGAERYHRDDQCVVFNLKTRFKQRIVGSDWAVEDFPSRWGPRFDAGSLGLSGFPMNADNSSCCLTK